MVNKAVIFVFATLLLLPLASAVDTEINVKTLPNHDVSIFVLEDSERYNLLDSYHLDSDLQGMTSATYSGSQSSVQIKVRISKNGVENMFEDFDVFETGEHLYLQLLPGDISRNYMEGVEEEENNTSAAMKEEIVETSGEEGEEAAPITGAAITGETNENTGSNTIYYLVGIIVVAGILGLIIARRFVLRRGSPPHEFRKQIKDKSEREEPYYSDEGVEDPELIEAERKIKEAQAEIKLMKNKSKIRDMERKLEADRAELERLKGGS